LESFSLITEVLPRIVVGVVGCCMVQFEYLFLGSKVKAQGLF
jgi:hypothetical protein